MRLRIIIDKVSVAVVAALFLALMPAMGLHAQSLYWGVDMNALFDNREGDSHHAPAETFFQAQIAPEIGVDLLNGQHRIAGGAVWTQPIGCEWDGRLVSPTLYYRYASQKWRFAMGMFPRTQLRRMLPNYVWSDSVYYCQRNIRGVMAQYEGRDGFIEGIIDWRGMQSETRREAFNLIVQGEWQRPGNLFLAGGLAMMNHLAKSKNPPIDQYVIDNFVVNPYVGLDLGSRFAALDSCTLRVGLLTSIARDRADSEWKTPAGVWADMCVQWRWLGVKNTFYGGGRLYPLYGKFGALLDQGEPYYASKYYNRTSVYATLMNNAFMNLRASLDFNVTENNFNFYQKLILRVYIDSAFSRNKGTKAKLPLMMP